MTEKSKLTEELMRLYGLSDEPVAPPPAPDGSPAPVETVVAQPSGGGNPFVDLKRRQEEAAKKQPPKNEFERNPELTGLSAVLGGMAQYKGAGQDLFKPEASLFTYNRPPPPIPQIGAVSPMGAQPLSDVEHTMQSGQGQRPGETGRMRENTHNQETQRQALAAKQGIQLPGASNLIVNAGPMYTTESGVAIPKTAAIQLEQELQAKKAVEAEQRRQILEKQALEQQRLQQQKARREQMIGSAKGAVKGTAQMGQGFVGGALAAPQLYEYGRDVMNPKKTADATQGISGIGGLMMALGKSKLGGLGALAQIPYIVKNRDELARSQMLSDVVPDTMRMGMTGSEMFEPAGNMPVKPFPINDGRR
jgi:hypothetical protein